MNQIVTESTPELILENGVKIGNFSVSNHGVGEITKMSEFRKNRELCDAVLLTTSDDTKIFVHRLVLSTGSEYFRSLFQKNTEGVKFVAPLKDVSGTVLLQIVDFLYTGKIKLTDEDVEEFLKWSNVYQLHNLTSFCEQFFILNIDLRNVRKYKEIAITYGCENLAQEIRKFLDENFMKLYPTEMLQKISVSDLKELLSRSTLRCDSEENIFAAVSHWAKFNPKEREQYLMELLPCIRFPLLSPSCILDCVEAFSGGNEAVLHCIKAIKWHNLSKEDKNKSGEFCTTPRVSVEKVDCIAYEKVGQTTALQPFVRYKNRFFTYSVAGKAWKKVYSTKKSIYAICAKDGNQILFVKNIQALEYFLIDLTDPSQNEKVIATPVYNGNKVRLSATCIVKNEIYLIGGYCNGVTTNKVSVFNLTTNDMREIASMQVPRSRARAILFNNCIYVLGGWNASSLKANSFCNVEKFDINTGEWSTMAHLVHARRESQCLIYNQMLYVFGNGTKVVERYDFLNNEWNVAFSEVPFDWIDNAVVIRNEFFVTSSNESYRYDNYRQNWVKCAYLY